MKDAKTRLLCVRVGVTAILRAYNAAQSDDEREEIAKEIARLDSGGARQALADMADKSWETA